MAKSESGQGNFFQRHSRELLFAGAVAVGGAAAGAFAVTIYEVHEINNERAYLETFPQVDHNFSVEQRKAELDLEAAGHTTALIIYEATLLTTAVAASIALNKKPQQA